MGIDVTGLTALNRIEPSAQFDVHGNTFQHVGDSDCAMSRGKHLDDGQSVRPEADTASYDVRDLHQAPPLPLMDC